MIRTVCLVLFALDTHPRWRLVLLANRDEFLARPSDPMGFWPERPDLLAGRDRAGGGTWLGLTASGRFGCITNFREGEPYRAAAPSRGKLLLDYLTGAAGPGEYLAAVEGSRYGGFNVLLADREGMHYGSNRGAGPRALGPGLYGVSNHLLDTPWPKVERGKRLLGEALANGAEPEAEALLRILADDLRPPDTELPETGVGLVRERELGPIMIRTSVYGTRASTVVLAGRDGEVTAVEKSWDDGAVRRFTLRIA
jgi:uncharacterized protein with NRDE domain